MPGLSHRPRCSSPLRSLLPVALLGMASLLSAQTPARPPAADGAAVPKPISNRQMRQADDAYLEGAKQMERNQPAAAEASFARAVKLNPQRQEYALALTVAREHHLTEIVQAAAKARLAGDNAGADRLLAEARAIDPDNSIVTQHNGDHGGFTGLFDPTALHSDQNIPHFEGPIELDTTPGKQTFHRHGSTQDVIREVYRAFGITVVFDDSVPSGLPVNFDLEDVDFLTATRLLGRMTHTFAVPVQAKSALIAKDTADNRDRLAPLVEETIYLPGVTADAMTELANLARNVFDLKTVTASPTGGDILVRGDEQTLRLLNATYADMLDGGSDVLIDVHLYELDKTHMVNIGAQLPSGASLFPLASTAENLINSNQTLINQAISSGLLKLTGNQSVDLLAELELLIAANVSGTSQFTNLLTVLGHFDGLPFAGLALASTSTFNLLLNSTDVRTLDDIQVRATDNQPVNFRTGTRYPIVTATYSSGVSSSLASSLAGININGQSAASLAAQYLGTSSVSIPQVQYEDLGITLKATPKIERSGDVSMQLDMKIEALGSGSLNSIPVLNNRALTSTVTVPAGQSAILASVLTRNEMRAAEGLPGLSELPGFQGTDKSDEVDASELLITITPHVVRSRSMHVTSRRLVFANAQQGPQ